MLLESRVEVRTTPTAFDAESCGTSRLGSLLHTTFDSIDFVVLTDVDGDSSPMMPLLDSAPNCI